MNKLTILTIVLGAFAVQSATAAVLPAKPRYTTYTSTDTCSSQLGYMKRVYVSDLENVYDVEDVWVTPMCEGDDYALFRSEGNAGALRGYIAQSDVLSEALARANFGADDVIAVRMTGENKVTLYVHEFHR